MDKSIEEILRTSLYSDGANLLTKRTLVEILRFNDRFDGSVEWFRQLEAISDTIYEIGNGLSVIHGVCLAIMENHWEELPQDWRSIYHDDFLIYTYKKYNRKPNTIRADLRAIRVFLLDEEIAKPFGTIEVPKRNQCGETIRDDTGKILTERVEWDPLKSTLPKLKVAVPLVEQDKMSEPVWAMLYDDKVSSSQMIQNIYEVTSDDPNPPQLGIKFRLEGPVLVAYENGNQEIELGELDWEGYYDEPYSLKHRAMDKLLALLGLTLDEHITMYRSREDENNAYYKD